VPYNEDPARYVCNAIAPAEVSRVLIDAENHTMELIVPDDKLSLAIGRRGQNVRLASQLSGWRIDIHSESKVQEMETTAIHYMQKIDGVSADLADSLYKLGWRSVEDIATSDVDELTPIPGMGSAEVAASIVEGAKAVQETIVSKKRELSAFLRLEQQKTPLERISQLEGIDDTLAEKLVAGYDRVEQIGKEQDLYRLAKSAEVGLTRAEHIRWTVRTYLGELDPEVFLAPEVDADESIVPKDEGDLSKGETSRVAASEGGANEGKATAEGMSPVVAGDALTGSGSSETTAGGEARV